MTKQELANRNFINGVDADLEAMRAKLNSDFYALRERLDNERSNNTQNLSQNRCQVGRKSLKQRLLKLCGVRRVGLN